MEDRRNELGSHPVGPLLVRYATPAMFAMLVSATYNLVDTIFVGYGAGTLALAALAISFPIQMVLIAVGMTIGIGSASVISRSLGAGNQRLAEQTAGTSFIVTGTIAAVLSGLGIVFVDPVAQAFGASDDVLPYARDYLSIILIGGIVFAISITANNIVRAEGNARTAMVSMVLGAVINIILDPIFIFGLDMGIRGAAWATLIANFSTFAFLCWYFFTGKSMLRIARADLLPNPSVLPEVFQVGASTFFQMLAGSLMAIPINQMILQYGADIHLAVLGVGNRAMMFFFMPIFGLVQGLQPIIGFNYGAGSYDRVLEATRKAAVYASVLSTVAFATMMFGTYYVLRMFSPDPEIITEGVPIIRIVILAMPFVGFQMVGTTLFQSLGKARPAFVLSLARPVLLLLPLVIVLPKFFGITGIWSAFPLSDIIGIALTAVWVAYEWRQLQQKRLAIPPVDLDAPVEQPAK